MKKENIKMVEIRDTCTIIPVFAIRIFPQTEEEKFIVKNYHYGNYESSFPRVILASVYSPWVYVNNYSENRGRTMAIAHKYIEENFDEISSCEVIDVEFILREVENPCKSLKQETEESL